MRRKLAAVGSAAFFALGPGVVAGVIPRKLTRGRVGRPLPGGMPMRVAGGVLVAGGAAVLIHAFARFVVEGLGTPAPVAPPQHLVTGGLYRHVRNPMYLAVGAAIVGQAALLDQPVLLFYAAGVTVVVVAFVRYYEEPMLARSSKPECEEFRRKCSRLVAAAASLASLTGSDRCDREAGGAVRPARALALRWNGVAA